MKETIFILGGCRSGKSRYALKLADNVEGVRKIFIATCDPSDYEMKESVKFHQKERPKTWHTLEIPVLLPENIIEWSLKSNVILVDCLSLWINNLMLQTCDIDKIEDHVQRLAFSVQQASCPVILVSNEVGSGIVPDNKLARIFRDALGLANQQIAPISDKVIWMVAGIPVVIKETAVRH